VLPLPVYAYLSAARNIMRLLGLPLEHLLEIWICRDSFIIDHAHFLAQQALAISHLSYPVRT
jgi:hypothetical protein